MDKVPPKQKEARLYYRNKFVKSLYFYSFLGLALIVLANLLFSSVGLAMDLGQRDAAWFIVALSISAAALILAGVLAGLTFVGGASGLTLKRVKATEIIRIILRFLNAFGGTALFVTAFLRDGEVQESWIPLLQGYGLAILTIEGLMAFYAVWRVAWVAANPEKYTTPAGQDYLEATSPLAIKLKTPSPQKTGDSTKDAPKETIEVKTKPVSKNPKK